jgi:predicted lipid-binding transport protein (Tim44 family)
MTRNRIRPLLALLAIVATFVFLVAEADARSRVGGGSRGTRTFTPPAATQTAPNTARPIERTMTQPGASTTQPGAFAQRPATQGLGSGLFNRPGFMGGLFAGLLGAGLIGLLLGHGALGGLGGLASFLGLALQIGIVAMVGWLLWRWWQNRSQPAVAGPPGLQNVAHEPYRPRSALGGLGGGLGAATQPAPAQSGGDEIGVKPEDFETFERMLNDIQTAYGNEDLAKLRGLVTPEMLSYYAEELAENASSGVVNKLTDIKLLQGDLSEAWREGETEYATVAMRYSLNDQIVDRTSNRVVDGGPDEATEVWTFMRVRGRNWLVSAVQQV